MTSTEYKIILVSTDEDVILIKKDYCRKCSHKLDSICLAEWDATSEDFHYLRRYRTKIVSVKCKCHLCRAGLNDNND